VDSYALSLLTGLTVSRPGRDLTLSGCDLALSSRVPVLFGHDPAIPDQSLSGASRDLAIPGAKLSLSSHERAAPGRDLTLSGRDLASTDFGSDSGLRASGLVVARRFAIVTNDVRICRRPVRPSCVD